MSTRCSKTIFRPHSFGGCPCTNPAKVERNGKHYCAIHDPERVKQKQLERNAAWERERVAKQARHDATKAKEAAVERDAARYRWLRANAVVLADYAFSVDEEVEAAIDAALAAIASAEGATAGVIKP